MSSITERVRERLLNAHTDPSNWLLHSREIITNADLSDIAAEEQALRDCVEALQKARDDINWMLNERKFLNADTFAYLDAALSRLNAAKE